MFQGKKLGFVIPAAGKGSRMKRGKAKQLIELRGKPILFHTLERLQSIPEIDIIILAVATDTIDLLRNIIAHYQFHCRCEIVAGGPERQDSVWNGLQQLRSRNVDIVVVHDAVRPFIDRELVVNICHAALQYGAAVPVIRPKDTIKSVNGNGYIHSTLDREKLVMAQTPQGFHFETLLKAYETAHHDGYYGTDDASLVERCGIHVKVIEGSYRNIKITTEDDLLTAQSFLNDI